MSENVLEIRDLYIHLTGYEGVAKVINGVNLTVGAGETVALVGETGCGKSITAKAVLRLLPPTARVVQGSLRFQGEDLLSLSEAEMQQKVRGHRISMVFQDPMSALNPVFTIGQVMTDVVRWSGQRPSFWRYWVRRFDRRGLQEARALAADWLRRVNLPDPQEQLNRCPVQLSGGMRQRVLIALALITRPRLVIADEPGTALDVSIQDQVLKLLRQLTQEEGTSVLYITHDLGVARQMSDRIYVMYAGEVAETAPTRTLFQVQYHPYTQGLLDAVPKLTGTMGEGIAGRIPDYVAPPPGCRFSPRCPMRFAACDTLRPRLVEVGPGHHVACHLHDPEVRHP